MTMAMAMAMAMAMTMTMVGFLFAKRRRRSKTRTVVLLLAFAMAFVETTHRHLGRFYRPGVDALTLAQRRAMVLSRIKRGMALSQEAKHNVTAAEEACGVWETVLSRISSSSSSSSSIVSDDVLSLSKTLYASCLVRVGRDGEAVSVYDSCLDSADLHKRQDRTNWKLAKARCLQRLLQYAEAAKEYLGVVEDWKENESNSSNSSGSTTSGEQEARLGAATCILRSTGDVTLAREVLAEPLAATTKAIAPANDVLLLSSCLEYFETGDGNRAVNRLQEILSTVEDNAVANGGNDNNSSEPTSFLLYRWILATLKQKKGHHKNLEKEKSTSVSPAASKERKNATTEAAIDAKDLFLNLIRINTSPLDDPNLLRLDDKIELHGLLRGTNSDNLTTSYWPQGFVIPDQSSALKEKPIGPNEDSELWIAKSRAGYGSHGNRILTLAEAREENVGEASGTEPHLLQRMVDPLLLLRGYKFSLRIYVIYFSSEEAYISSKGLVKLASAPLLADDGDASGVETGFRDASMHMTNSGRETVMRQENLEYLWKELDTEEEREALWKGICGVAADILLHRYPGTDSGSGAFSFEKEEKEKEEARVWKDRREAFGIPKILGLDFVVDGAQRKPWLVEVNRFPGLEPRDEDDRKIKYGVVGDAWKKAAERFAMVKDEEDEDEDENGNRATLDGTVFDALRCYEEGDAKSSLQRLHL